MPKLTYGSKKEDHHSTTGHLQPIAIKKDGRISPKSIKKESTRFTERLLDFKFFDKCFMGKQLGEKDQTLFNVYAEELLHLIKNKISS